MKAVLSSENRQSALRKADDVQKTEFEAEVSRSVSMVYKADDDFFIWGPASVEVVDKENDKIRVEALEKALPQLLKRARLSYAHTDQIVGQILERFSAAEPVKVTINGETFKRQEFPTDVLDLDKMDNPALFVAGEVYDDTDQSTDVREKIEEGEVNSYSISGEALVTRKQVEGDMVYDDILELDLSAVTLCEEGMNPGAQFARVDGDINDVETPDDTEKAYTVEDGRLTSPDQLATAVSKSESEPMSENDDSETLPDDAAVKSLVKEQIEEAFEEKFGKQFDIHMSERGDEMVKEALSQALPDEPLATKGYVDAAIQQAVEKEGVDPDEIEDPDDDGEEEVDIDTEEDDEMPEEGEDEEDEEMEDGDYEEDGKSFTEAELKENLPSDVYDVVSEYVGTSKEAEQDQSPADAQADELGKQVEAVLSGGGPETPTLGVGDREDELEKQSADADEDGEFGDSPALSNFDHHE